MKKRLSRPRRRISDLPDFAPSLLDDVVDTLRWGGPLGDNREAVLEICEALRKGQDARELFGIKPNRGAPPVTRKYRLWIAQHYWKLRQVRGSKELADATHVAKAWRVGIQTVRKCFAECREDGAWAGPELEQMEAIARHFAPEYKRLRRKG